ncbi:MAG: TIGR02996 domain-containing protein [Gemmataceae bacterium]
MDRLDELLAGVLIAPRDDLPRLLYADALEERGAPADVARAEFIRVQCELAQAENLDARIREKALLSLHGPQWLEPLRKRGEPLFNRGTHAQFVRGFVEIVWMPAGVFVAKAAKLFSKAPVQELRVVRATAAELVALFDHPLLARLTRLDLSDRRYEHRLAELLTSSPYTRGLEVVRLRACGLLDAAATLLCEVPRDWQPRVIDLSHNVFSPAGLAQLRRRYGAALVWETTASGV